MKWEPTGWISEVKRRCPECYCPRGSRSEKSAYQGQQREAGRDAAAQGCGFNEFHLVAADTFDQVHLAQTPDQRFIELLIEGYAGAKGIVLNLKDRQMSSLFLLGLKKVSQQLLGCLEKIDFLLEHVQMQ